MEKSQQEEFRLRIGGGAIAIESLVGPHLLYGVELGKRVNNYEDANTIAFLLGEIGYVAVEDPEDGLRSSLGPLELANPEAIKNRFGPIPVTARWIQEDTRHVLEFVDDANGEVVMIIGTDQYDDLYPSFVGHWYPQNLAINKKD